MDSCKNCIGMEECKDCDGNIALKILVDMFFQQFLTMAHFMCPLRLIELGKEANFRKFLLKCLHENLEKFHEQNNGGDS